MRNESLLFGTLILGAVAGLAVTVPATQARADAAGGVGPTIDVSEIHEGMKGYGLTVFHGTEPERFDVEVIGVLHNFRAAQDLILVKTMHPRLETVKMVAGMSGSPIFLDGRLAGAYAYGWQFQSEPIAGVTPIAPMLTELARPIPPALRGFLARPLASSAGPSSPRHASLDTAGTSFDGAPGAYDLGAHAAAVAARMAAPPGAAYVRASTPLLLAGVGDRATALLRTLVEPLGLDPLQAGGGGNRPPAADAPAHYIDGGGLGVQLVRGDVSIMGLGTTTHVVGTKLVGWGHPLMTSGDTAMPACVARVLWINATLAGSFKLGECARPLGTLIEDRPSAIVVDEARRASMIPVSIDVTGVDGAPRKSWHMEVTEDRFMGPSLAATALGSAVEATISDQRDITWQLTSRLTIRGHGTLTLEDFGVAIGGMPEAGEINRMRIIRALGDAMNNPWEEVAIEKLESTLTVKYDRDLWHLRGVELLGDVVDAGKSAHIRLHLVPYQGQEIVREVEMRIPAELGGSEVEIEVMPGYDVVPELAAPDNLPELLANETRQSLPPRSVVLQVKLPAQGVVFRGGFAPHLPGFAFDALRPAHSDTGAEAIATYARSVVPMDRYIDGHDKVKVKVRRPMR